ncbi:MAG: ABC transporter [Gammaproteobacteria bacterium]|jgi:ABC-type uncharacterized transport system involved in gliding motility auxiliary subunit|nr:ABC transporter [Gammaproteobacteria bacterium]MBT5203760.1 ABC transporter [Gammaproteobacteria bacterium]MBT5601805.1 ABC transporter [Gammaproteobacteria bacterium]MBT6247429.1 ABC transporter [Gammaproteobacteria bacterium]
MKNYLNSVSSVVFILVGFLVFSVFNNTFFHQVRLDLTENKLFTLTQGSGEIVAALDEPIHLYFFFSEKASADLTSLRTYADRVASLLEEYALLSNGKIKLSRVNPEPFSEQEDQAAAFGLQAIPVSAGGDELYFGLAGTNALDQVEIIRFFQPDKEEFLEYEVSKLIQGLNTTGKPKVGLISSLPVRSRVDPNTFQTTPGWVSISQLDSFFEVIEIEPTADTLQEGLDMLILLHPKNLSETMQRGIDQYLMNGGKLLAFVDPLSELDRPAQTNPMMPVLPQGQGSDLNWLTAAWGVSLRASAVLGDSQNALTVSSANGTPVRHLAILGLGPDALRTDDVITSGLESLNFSTAGILDIDDAKDVIVTPLILSSEYSGPLDTVQFQFLRDPADLQKSLKITGEAYPLAVRLSGPARSAFSVAPDDAQTDAKSSSNQTDDLNLILVADTDVLSDRLWVQVQNFFGQEIASPWADNGDFLVNAVDNLGGSTALISVRSRGRFTRPFEAVQDLRRQAEAKYLESAEALQLRLTETERKLSELQSSKVQDMSLNLSPEEESALLQFQEEKLVIRKQLRDVRHQLDKDIEQLGSTLKFVNIALVPILLTLLLLAINVLRGRKEEVIS